ncbi:MAG: holo-ACP synthase [Planctomycetota bacterium]
MPVLGHGLDLVETARIAALLERHDQAFRDRVFTPDEQRYCERNARRRVEHYAVRFAAKEAAFKALGTGVSGGIRWTDAQVLRLPSGQPQLQLQGHARQVADDLGIARFLLSLTHVGPMAAASVLAVSDPA